MASLEPLLQNNIFNYDDMIAILGRANSSSKYTNGVTTEKYEINDNFCLAVDYDADNILIYIGWFPATSCGTFHSEIIELENIFEQLPEQWQKKIIFNIDIFKHQGYLPVAGAFRHSI